MIRKLSIILLMVALGLQLVSAETIKIPADQSTIQAGIDASSNGDTVLVSDGIYSGPGNINLSFGGRSIVVTSKAGPDNCIINCQSAGQGFYFHNNETEDAVLSGFSIVYGASGAGGAIHIADASPKIEHCILSLNHGDYGGGIFISGGSPQIINCVLVENSAQSGGAIFFADSDPFIGNCIIVNNQSSG